MSGWVKLHRKLLEWEWFHDKNTFRLFVYLILKANHEKKTWRGVEVLPGQVITGRRILSAETGISEQGIRTSLERLKTTSEITIKTYNKFSLITLKSWNLYQIDEPANQRTNTKGATNLDTTKEVKKKRRKNNTVSKRDLVWDSLVCEYKIPKRLESRIGKAVKQLKQAEVTPNQIWAISQTWGAVYETASRPSFDKFAQNITTYLEQFRAIKAENGDKFREIQKILKGKRCPYIAKT